MYNLNPLMRNVLITSNEVIFHAPTKHTLDPRTIEQSIIIAEERFIRPELGFALYDALCAEKNKIVTADNLADLQAHFSKYRLQEGNVVNALEFLSVNNLALWKQHLWKLIAECVMIIATPEAYIQFASEGIVHTVAPMSPMGGSGTVSPELQSVKWIMDQKQYRIDPLNQSMHNYICVTKSYFPLYTRDCPCDNESKQSKRSDVILGIYDDEPESCRCYERRTYH
jgi:hypothetical protein